MNVEITMETKRCFDCGRYWAHEKFYDGICPRCAGRTLNALRAELDSATRVNRSLRGALTRAKKTRSGRQ